MGSFQDIDFENMEDLYPVPFPDDVPIAQLETISLNKLLNNDEVEAQRIFDICTGSGFFYLDMKDHPMGKKMWANACYACRSGQAILPVTPMATKKAYKARAGIKVLDRGYQTGAVNENGQPRDSEMFMIPQTEFFGKEAVDFELPPWLAPHEEAFKNALRSGNIIANVILSILELKLELPPGTFTNLHKLIDSSGDFLRVLRYPGTQIPAEMDPLRFPPHRDAVSVAILFTWLGGLQIVDGDAASMQNPFAVPETAWRWIKPVPGTAVVNLGDAMEVFSNKVLKSGLHRVIKAPGLQRAHDKYSVLIVARPEDNTPMRSFKSAVIPEDTEEQKNAQVYSSIEWGNNKIKALQDFIDKLQSARAGKTENLERSW